MDELIQQVIRQLKTAWVYRWWALGAAWVIGVGLAMAVLSIPDRYESSARIYVDTQSILRPLMSGLAVQPNVDQQVAILSRTLISRPTIEKLMQMADLDTTVKSREEREALIARLTSTLKIQAAGANNLYTLAYQDENPQRARRVVQSLMSIFVESGLGDKRKDSDSAKRFIDEQIKVYEEKLSESENRLKDFKLNNMDLMGSKGSDFVGQIGSSSEQLKQAQLDLKEAVNARDSLKIQINSESALSLNAPSSNVALPEIDGRIDAQKKALDGLLQRYTESHPDVIGVRRVISQLEEEKEKAIEANRVSGGESSHINAPNPVFQQMKISLTEADARVSSLQARVAEYQERLRKLQESAKKVPELEAEFSQLNRDYSAYQANYQALVARREAASIGAELDSTSGIAEFRLIDPPSLPTKPAAPNRPTLAVGAAIVGLASGLGFALLISQVRPIIIDAGGLRSVSRLPVLGVVSMIATENRRRRERRLLTAYAGGVGAYGIFFGVLMAMTLLGKG